MATTKEGLVPAEQMPVAFAALAQLQPSECSTKSCNLHAPTVHERDLQEILLALDLGTLDVAEEDVLSIIRLQAEQRNSSDIGRQVKAAQEASTPIQLEFDPASHDFGELSVGGNATKTFVLTNTGTGRVHFQDSYPRVVEIGSDAYSMSATTCAIGLDPTEWCEIEVTFTPSAAGTPSAFIAVRVEESSDLFTARLRGEAVGIESYSLTFDPVSHDFGELSVGGSATKTFVLTNTGTGRVHFPDQYPRVVELGSDAYSMSATTCAIGLDPTEWCEIEVTFAPSAAGTPSAFIAVRVEESSDLFTAWLRGESVGIESYLLTFDPVSHDFGELSVGGSATKTFVLTNTGTGRVHFPDQYPRVVELGSDAYSMSATTCAIGLDPTEWCEIEVTFAPSAAGTPSAFIAVRVEESYDLFTAYSRGRSNFIIFKDSFE